MELIERLLVDAGEHVRRRFGANPGTGARIGRGGLRFRPSGSAVGAIAPRLPLIVMAANWKT